MGNDMLIGSTSSLYFNIGGLAGNNTYRYRVQARDRAGNKSEMSDIFTVKTNINTSVNKTSTNQICIFPNPATEYLIITGASVYSKISVYNMEGKLQIQTVISNLQQTIDIKNLPSGMYIVKINNGNTLIVDRFIKK